MHLIMGHRGGCQLKHILTIVARMALLMGRQALKEEDGDENRVDLREALQVVELSPGFLNSEM